MKPVHPGIIFKETILDNTDLTITAAAEKLGVSRKTLSELINGHVGLSAEMAIRISKASKTSSKFWLNIQKDVDLWNSEQEQYQVIPFNFKNAIHDECKEELLEC